MANTALQDDGSRVRITANIGPRPSIEQIEDVLQWLRVVQDLAETIDGVNGGSGGRTSQSSTRGAQAQPARTLWIEQLRFTNPLELILGGPLCLLVYYLVILIRDWTSHREGERLRLDLLRRFAEQALDRSLPARERAEALAVVEEWLGHRGAQSPAASADLDARVISTGRPPRRDVHNTGNRDYDRSDVADPSSEVSPPQQGNPPQPDSPRPGSPTPTLQPRAPWPLDPEDHVGPPDNFDRPSQQRSDEPTTVGSNPEPSNTSLTSGAGRARPIDQRDATHTNQRTPDEPGQRADPQRRDGR